MQRKSNFLESVPMPLSIRTPPQPLRLLQKRLRVRRAILRNQLVRILMLQAVQPLPDLRGLQLAELMHLHFHHEGQKHQLLRQRQGRNQPCYGVVHHLSKSIRDVVDLHHITPLGVGNGQLANLEGQPDVPPTSRHTRRAQVQRLGLEQPSVPSLAQALLQDQPHLVLLVRGETQPAPGQSAAEAEAHRLGEIHGVGDGDDGQGGLGGGGPGEQVVQRPTHAGHQLVDLIDEQDHTRELPAAVPLLQLLQGPVAAHPLFLGVDLAQDLHKSIPSLINHEPVDVHEPVGLHGLHPRGLGAGHHLPHLTVRGQDAGGLPGARHPVDEEDTSCVSVR
mmetsp:Transcript_3534/g.8659  ORF Transcript_3534/g.8659 Transcript_3534/m.8659 type:complete len:334 (-) Transcript_3534:905-1906(-)